MKTTWMSKGRRRLRSITTVAEVNFSLEKSPAITHVDDPSIPDQQVLAVNYPNPFNAQTTISMTMPESMSVEVTIFDALGREVDRVFHGVLPAGSHQLAWSPELTNLSGGLYFYRIVSDRQTISGKMMYLP